jgi:hypothetical protein
MRLSTYVSQDFRVSRSMYSSSPQSSGAFLMPISCPWYRYSVPPSVPRSMASSFADNSLYCGESEAKRETDLPLSWFSKKTAFQPS